ncbi:hypothetical protein L1049_003162 [Liquidambar formosana]|uniref:RRM domain-containing protein n=1 Tax=Liquidambar formosana TaxID=63359 RepID=A0AAP0NH42_LIQFO
MAKTNKTRRRKHPQKPDKVIGKKPNKKKLRKAIPTKQDPCNDSDSDSSLPDSDPQRVQILLEPYSKDQLVDLIVDFAIKDSSLYNRIRDTADRDVAHRKIFVHGLGWDTTRETLTKSFESYGEIEECNVVTDRNTGKAKGYGFVMFKTRQGAAKALKQPQKKINNRVASCQLASVGPVVPTTAQSQDAMGRKIYVSNVQADVDPEKLRSFFARFGEIETGPIGFDMQTGKSRGFALFVYKTVEGARNVLVEPYKMFEGHQLHCQKATDGKNKAAAAAAQQPVQGQAPVLAAVAAAQNMMFNQHPGLNPMYAGLIGNHSAGFMAGPVNPMMAAGVLSSGVIPSSQVGQVAGSSFGNAPAGFGGYSAGPQVGNLGGNQSVLGAYGSSGPTLGLQHAYPNTQMGQPSLARAHGTGGSFSGYPSQICSPSSLS